MSRSMAPKQAEALLEKQIGVLGSLRNAGTRAPEFREWRQATLTLIERIWPDQPTRAQRFRRIPFSVAASKADERVTREAFERGCAEARRLLHLWLTEISTHGIRQEPEAPRLTEAVRAALDEQHPPVADLRLPAAEEPRRPQKPAPRPVPKARKRKEQLSEMLGFVETDVPPRTAGPSTAPADPPSMPAPIAKVVPPAKPLPPGVRPVPPAAKAPPASRTPQVVKPLAVVPAPAAPAQPVTPAVPPAANRAPAPLPPAKPAPAVAVPQARPPAAPAPADAAFDDALAHSIDSALERALHETEAIAGAPSGFHEPAAPREGPRERPMVSYVARAFIGMARDLEELGVPEAHRDRVRLALLDLARHLDAGSVTWHLMRDAITLVMHYPPLGRQALPLLLPYLESAA